MLGLVADEALAVAVAVEAGLAEGTIHGVGFTQKTEVNGVFATLPPDARVLCLFLGNRGYYMNFKLVFEQPHENGLFARFLAAPEQSLAITAAMREKGITHVLMRDDLAAAWLHQLDEADRQRIAPLFANAAQPLLRQNGHSIFPIAD